MAYIIKRNGRFYVIVERGVDPLTGRRRNKESHPAGTRRRDAENLKTRIEAAKLDRTYKPRDRITLTDYLTERWLPVHERRVAPTTADQYGRNIRLYVTPHIGHVSVQDLRADHLDALYETLLTSGGQDGRGLAPRTVGTVHAMLRRALADAVRKELVAVNVATAADAPAVPRRSEGVHVWSPEELGRFLAAVADHRLYSAFFLGAYTGLRAGELAGLRWGDIDLEAKTLTVERQIRRVGGALQVGPPKAAASRRVVTLDEGTVAELRQHRRRQRHADMASGTRGGGGYVFGDDEGRAISPALIGDAFRRAVARVGVPPISLHGLRHTHATVLMASGTNPKVVSDRLGHSKVAMTLDTYTHVSPAMQAEAARAFAAIVAATGEST